ncbi:spermatogenesis-associated protein 22-like isoform X1 [Gigantopelta aegis]|uniref:spermatogenesis-associated protein 22-like isoform X1 n=1 Tax=Gigantopelta aegis TaxID=1735272 RepID=UPI001B88783A|nr:spermatogenesis-associated protein 22-like isoform X1 [Gigantopelta aegis]
MQSNQGGRPTPAPIFNHKKRQRQAMFADPLSSGTLTSSTNCSELMPVDGFNRKNGGNPNASAFSHNQFSRNNAGDRGQFNYSCANSMFSQQGKTKYSSLSVNNATSQRGSNQQNISRGGGNNRGFGGSHQLCPSSKVVQRQWQPQRGQSQSHLFNEDMDDVFDSTMDDGFESNPSNQWGQSRNTTSSISNQYNHRQQTWGSVSNSSMSNRAPSSGRPKPPSTSSMNVWGGAPAQASPVAACPVPQQLPAFPRSNKNQFNAQQSLYTNCERNQNRVPNATKPAAQGSNQYKKAKVAEVDKSLKVLTLATSSIKKWHQMNIQLCPVIFEVYGIIDSAVLRDKTGLGKEFLLRDEEDKLHCVFYEIDRELPRLIRGQWHRCVGSLDSRTGVMKCVSVRPASNEERQMAKSVMQASEKTLTRLIHYSREP